MFCFEPLIEFDQRPKITLVYILFLSSYWFTCFYDKNHHLHRWMILNLTLEINCIFSVLIIVSEIYDLDKQEREEMEFVDGRETRRRDKGEDAMSTPPPLPSFVTITTIAISPIPNRSSPPPWLLRSVFTGVATTSVTLVTSFFLSERVNLLSFSPTSWWSQREVGFCSCIVLCIAWVLDLRDYKT